MHLKQFFIISFWQNLLNLGILFQFRTKSTVKTSLKMSKIVSFKQQYIKYFPRSFQPMSKTALVANDSILVHTFSTKG